MATNAKVNIFVLGATGYIGGAVLTKLLEHPKANDFNVTALVRSTEKAEKLKSVGVTPVLGSLDDTDFVHKLSSDSDVVISMANADHAPSVQAMLSGQKEHFQKTGKQPIFIHTVGVLSDNAEGLYHTETIWNDADPAQIATIAPTQPHRDVDLLIVDADKEGYVRTYIILPSTIYGLAQGRLVDIGVSNNRSIQIPAIIEASLDREQGGMVGQGKNLWPNVHIDEQADLYIILLDAALSKPDTDHGTNGYYFGESGEHSLYDVGKAVAEALVELGIGSPKPTAFTKAEIDKYFGGSAYLGSNSRARANHSRAIGWTPKKTTADMLASIRAEVEEVLKRAKKLSKDLSAPWGFCEVSFLLLTLKLERQTMSANAKINIFVTGVTGYLGGAVVNRLISHPRVNDFRITALVRSPEKAEKLKLLGITPAIGSLDDTDLLHKLCSESDVVLAMADSDHYSSVKAMLDGQKERYNTTGKQGIFINTGSPLFQLSSAHATAELIFGFYLGVLVDNAAGMYQYDTIWNDANAAQMATLAPTQMHRDVDLMIVEADKEGYVKTYIVLPSTIYGIAQGRLVDLRISNNRSRQIPAIVRASLDRRQGGMVGLGKNVWPNVNIEEQADFFIILLNAALNKSETLGHGTDGYYFGESGEHSLYDVGKAVAEVLVDLGIGQSREPTTFTKDEIDKYFGGSDYLGSNSRCRADHARSLGWNPKKSTADMLASIRAEVEEEIKASAEGKLRKDQKL
ncbi:hypothetical protein EYR38_007901 [Pleurotus pulmonarius]|nr:hypothetical protein EYR38_007901 [Pleurotus pulmonarius]